MLAVDCESGGRALHGKPCHDDSGVHHRAACGLPVRNAFDRAGQRDHGNLYRCQDIFEDIPERGYSGELIFVVVGSVLYVNGQKKLQTENALLKRQVEELIMIDPLTNLYNLRSMFMDIQTQVSFAERNNQHISLMVIKLKYHEQLKKVLNQNQYEQVLVKVSKYVVDTVRLEDRVYAIDDIGSLAIILTTDALGCKSVVMRLRNKLDNTEAFMDIASQPIRVEVKIGYLEYNKEEFQRDARLFLSKVEEEASFDE